MATFKRLLGCGALFVFIACHFSSAGVAADPADSREIDRVANSTHWLRLGHYEWKFLRGWRSQVDDGQFFFAADGASDPRAELVATIDAFSKDIKVGRLKQHPQCAFPERFRYLKAELKLSIQPVECTQYEEFLKKFNAKSATLVFSSAYPNNPGSMFGHTFLRINSKSAGDKQKLDLLDQGVSYAAVVGDENGFVFAFYGIAGGYWGQFAVVPYYAKVNEYGNSESRDIWEYDLSLNEEETTRLIAHVWELETNALFQYFFFDENCSYVLLKLLEVAKTDWSLTDFPIYVIPGETVKKVVSVPGAVTGVRFRPSLRKRMIRRYDLLSSSQKNELLKIVSDRTLSSAASDANVLEATSLFLSYMKQKRADKFSAEDKGLLKEVLLKRSQLGTQAQTDPEAEKFDMNDRFDGATRPDPAHHTYRLGTSSGLQSRTEEGKGMKFFQELQFKFAFHDLMNNDRGYTPFSQIDFPGFILRYTDGKQGFNLEELQGLKIVSLFPFNFLEKSVSWKMAADLYTPKDYGCTTCHVGRFNGGGGITLETFSRYAILYGLVLLNFEVGDSLRKGFRFGPQSEVAFLYNPVERWKLHLGWTLQTDLLQSDRQKIVHALRAEQSLSLSQAWDVRVGYWAYLPTAQHDLNFQETKLTLNSYF